MGASGEREITLIDRDSTSSNSPVPAEKSTIFYATFSGFVPILLVRRLSSGCVVPITRSKSGALLILHLCSLNEATPMSPMPDS
jgi:hypothetical protein